jgi:hypothetical protein
MIFLVRRFIIMTKSKISPFKIHVISYTAGFIVQFSGMAICKHFHLFFLGDYSYVSLFLITLFTILTLMVWNLISNKNQTKKIKK